MKKNHINLIVIISILLTFIFTSFIARADAIAMTDTVDVHQIKEVINNYFEARGRSFKNLKLDDFNTLTINTSSNIDMQKEFEKLDLEIYHASLFQLNYLTYKYYLDFEEVKINPTTDAATVIMIVGRDIIFEVTAPSVSKIRNTPHEIRLQKENGVWKITADHYEDHLWQILKSTNLSHDELRNSITEAKKQLSEQTGKAIQNSTMTPQVNSYFTVHLYDGLGAANYADYWYDRINPAWYDFRYLGGDCTNFVSQAMYEKDDNGVPYGVHPYGGKARMTGKYDIYGNDWDGWYYISYISHNYATAWTGVGQLYDFLVTYKDNWYEGPFGEEVFPDIDNNNFAPLGFGDIIQYDWDADNFFDHSVIIDGINGEIPQVASHGGSDNNDWFRGWPYNYNLGYAPNEKFRFIHILGVKVPNTFTYLPISFNEYNGEFMNYSYPSPEQISTVGTPDDMGYPAPNQDKVEAYPAPKSKN